MGNILSISDRTPGSGIKDNPDAFTLPDIDPDLRNLLIAGDALYRKLEYDPLYRLRSATGRECKDIPKPRPWPDLPRCGFNSPNHGTPDQGNAPHLTALYKEEYRYDQAGNMVLLRHSAGDAPWNRHFGMGGLTPQQWQDYLAGILSPEIPPGNRLTHVGDNTGEQSHFYDANGNLLRESLSKHFEWDHSYRMKAFRNQLNGGGASVHAHYLYDADGQRVKKLVRKGSAPETTVYIDGLYEHHRWGADSPDSDKQNSHLHVMDGQQRIALARVGPKHPDDEGPAVQYHLGDHLASSSLIIDKDGSFINREEYAPYGETSFGSFARKRYRFTGKERDEETGLYYHGARYYAPWLTRWVSTDPVRSLNLYSYCLGNLLGYIDPGGREPARTNTTHEVGPYRTVRGDHVHQVASRTDTPGAKRTTASQFRGSLSVSTRDPGYRDESGQKVERAINRAAWGKEYQGKPAGESGKVWLTATGDTAVGKSLPATPSQSFEDIKSYFKLREAGVPPDDALRTVTESAQKLNEAGATPQRVPDAPRNVPRSLQQGQRLSPEGPARTMKSKLPRSVSPPLGGTKPRVTELDPKPKLGRVDALEILHDLAERAQVTGEYQTWRETFLLGPGPVIARTAYEAVEGARFAFDATIGRAAEAIVNDLHELSESEPAVFRAVPPYWDPSIPSGL